MKKIFLFFVIAIWAMSSVCFADTVYLKDGKTIHGKIEEETKYSVKIMVGGFPKVFYSDEIEKVEREGRAGLNAQDTALPEFAGEVSEEKRALILRLLTANGALEGIRQAMRHLLDGLSPEMREQLEMVLSTEGLTDRFIPIYAKYFSEDELKEMVRFYSSPIGQKLLKATPIITEESLSSTVEYLKAMEGQPMK